MAQKAPILLYQEAQSTFVNTINHYIQQGVPLYEIKSIIEKLNNELGQLVEQEITKAQEEYKAALQAEETAKEPEIEVIEKAE